MPEFDARRSRNWTGGGDRLRRALAKRSLTWPARQAIPAEPAAAKEPSGRAATPRRARERLVLGPFRW